MAEVVITSGKRKSAVARAYAHKGKGRVRINNLILQTYPAYLREIMGEPMQLAEKHGQKIDVNVRVRGGGPISQAEAARTAIAKALAESTKDGELKRMFMEYDRTLLVSDTRRREPKKQLGRGARKRRQKSYR
ncbi:MAG TPA: 30S ribosomal protein S9 [Thermoplasmatales archaeon]|nr:30S ribosomal protein S9 [Thermoplasmatales archaeon]